MHSFQKPSLFCQPVFQGSWVQTKQIHVKSLQEGQSDHSEHKATTIKQKYISAQKHTGANSHHPFWGPGFYEILIRLHCVCQCRFRKILGRARRTRWAQSRPWHIAADWQYWFVPSVSMATAMRGLSCWTHAGWRKVDITLYSQHCSMYVLLYKCLSFSSNENQSQHGWM